MENQNPEDCESVINEDNGDDSGFIDVGFLSLVLSFLSYMISLAGCVSRDVLQPCRGHGGLASQGSHRQ